MSRKGAPKPDISLAIGAEGRQLLALLAQRLGTSPSAVLESAIREKAQREQVTLPNQTAGTDAEAEPTARSSVGAFTPIDLRPLAARAATGDATATSELKRVIQELRATAIVQPAKRPEEFDPGWEDQFVALVDGLRRSVPAEWTQEELQEQIAQAVAEYATAVRATIDTSAWVSVVLSRLGRAKPIAEALRSGRVTLVTSEQAFAETAEVLERPRLVRTGEARLLARSLLSLIRERADFVTIAGTLQVCRDREDDMVIETALQGTADVLVTEDKDLLEDPNVLTALAAGGVRVLRVVRFLEELDARDDD